MYIIKEALAGRLRVFFFSKRCACSYDPRIKGLFFQYHESSVCSA